MSFAPYKRDGFMPSGLDMKGLKMRIFISHAWEDKPLALALA